MQCRFNLSMMPRGRGEQSAERLGETGEPPAIFVRCSTWLVTREQATAGTHDRGRSGTTITEPASRFVRRSCAWLHGGSRWSVGGADLQQRALSRRVALDG